MVIQPADRPEFSTRTSASLVFQALAPGSDPTLGSAVLYEHGEADWWRSVEQPEDGQPPSSSYKRPIAFLPSPSTAHRNQTLADYSLVND
jgi:hypothetical protein